MKKHIISLIITLITIASAACIIAVWVVPSIREAQLDAEKMKLYQKAVEYKDNAEYETALEIFIQLGDYFNAAEYAGQCIAAINYNIAAELMDSGRFSDALALFRELIPYKDSAAHIIFCEQSLLYENALLLLEQRNFGQAADLFNSLGDFKDSADLSKLCRTYIIYEQAKLCLSDDDYTQALELLRQIDVSFEDTENLLNDCINGLKYIEAMQAYESENFYTAYSVFSELGGYKDASEMLLLCVREYPETGEIFRHTDFPPSSAILHISLQDDDSDSVYIKIYDENNSILLTLFILAGEDITTGFPPGIYTIKAAFGTAWYGFNELFGDDGLYQILILSNEDGSHNFEKGKWELTLQPSADGNVSAIGITRPDF